MKKRDDILNARHLVASAGGDVASAAASVSRALAWQVGDEASVIASLETALAHASAAQRRLHEAITELRVATREPDAAIDPLPAADSAQRSRREQQT